MIKARRKNSYGDFILTAAGEKHNKALSIVSHDLKSPLSGMLGFSRLLAERMRVNGSDPSLVEFVNHIIRAGENMESLVNDINFMVKMEAGREKVEPFWVDDLEWELRETVRTFEFQAKAKNIELSLITRAQLPPVRWDMARLRNHTFNNIISNALKFTPEGGVITLSVVAVSGHVELRVEDTGPGILPGEEEKIFDRFGQLEAKSERSFSGVGLGLYNARLFVERHGGEISLDSLYKKGASFLIKLPFDAIIGGGSGSD